MSMNIKLDILVVSGGMYVTGNRSNSDGIIMPALPEARRQGLIRRLGLVTTSVDSIFSVSNHKI